MADSLTPNPWQVGPNGELVGERIDLLAADDTAAPVVGRAIRWLTGFGGDIMGAVFGSTLLGNYTTALQTQGAAGMLAQLNVVVMGAGDALIQAIVGDPSDPLTVRNVTIIDSDGESSFVQNAGGPGTLQLVTGSASVNASPGTPIPSLGSADFGVALDPAPGLAPDAVVCWVVDGGDLYYGLKVTGTGDLAVNRFAVTIESLIDTDLTAGALNLAYLAIYT